MLRNRFIGGISFCCFQYHKYAGADTSVTVSIRNLPQVYVGTVFKKLIFTRSRILEAALFPYFPSCLLCGLLHHWITVGTRLQSNSLAGVTPSTFLSYTSMDSYCRPKPSRSSESTPSRYRSTTFTPNRSNNHD